MKNEQACPFCDFNDSHRSHHQRRCNPCGARWTPKSHEINKKGKTVLKKGWYYGGRTGHTAFETKYVDPKIKKIKPEVEHKVIIKNKQLELQNSELKHENEILKAQTIDKERFISSMESGMHSLPLIKQIPFKSISKHKSTESVTLIFSDAHINRVIDFVEMEGFNEYNFEIFCQRFWYLIHSFLRVIEIERAGTKIDTLYIDMIGDVFNDIFRRENIATNQFVPGMAMVMGSSVIAQGFAILSAYFDKIIISGIIGNESRLTQKKEASQRYNNMDWLCYQMLSVALRRYIKSGRIKFNIPLSPELVIHKEGWKFLLTHGDTVKSWMGIPHYGIERQAAKQQTMRRSRGGFDFWEIAHFHTPGHLQERLMNGSICGTDEYAKSILHVTGPPTQKTFGLHRKRGVTWVRDIDLTDASEHRFKYSETSVSGEELNEAFDILKDEIDL